MRAVVTAVGHDRPGIVSEISQLVRELNLSIEDSRMTVLGGEFALLMSVTGGDLGLQRLATKVEQLATESDLQFTFRRTGDREGVEGRVPFKGPLTNTIHQLLGGVRGDAGRSRHRGGRRARPDCSGPAL